jgi:hypothetical protein
MEAIWVAAEMRAGGACAHSTLMLATLAQEDDRKRRPAPQLSNSSIRKRRASFGVAFGRPFGVAMDRVGALLVAEDGGNVVWRMTPTR